MRRRTRRTENPWARAPVDELGDQVLPRWFVVTALALVPVAIVTLIAAFVVFGPTDVPVAARRPPPGGGLTHAVGIFEAGTSEPVAYDQACALLAGIRIAGSQADRHALRTGLSTLCAVELTDPTRARLEAFAQAGGVVRFARFEATGVDSAAMLDADPPVIYVNARFTQSDPQAIAPVVAHDVTYVEGGVGTAETELAARRVEAAVCEAVFGAQRGSRACDDARAVVALEDPLAALRDAGYR